MPSSRPTTSSASIAFPPLSEVDVVWASFGILAFVEELPEVSGLVAPAPILGGSSNAAKPPAEADCTPVVGGGTALFDHASGLVAAGEA